jgi:hypothetical protein
VARQKLETQMTLTVAGAERIEAVVVWDLSTIPLTAQMNPRSPAENRFPVVGGGQ